MSNYGGGPPGEDYQNQQQQRQPRPQSSGQRQISKQGSGQYSQSSDQQDNGGQQMQKNTGNTAKQYAAINPNSAKYGMSTSQTTAGSTSQQPTTDPSIASSVQSSSQANRQTASAGGQTSKAAPQQSIPKQGSSNMSPLDRLKLIQQQYKASWVGINTDFSGRPGTSKMCNSERHFAKARQEQEEEIRMQKFIKILDTLRNIENDLPLLISSGNDRQSRTQQNFFNKGNKNLEQSLTNLASYVYTAPVQTFNQQIYIKSITKGQLLTRPLPTTGAGRGYHIDNCEMLYKLLKGDTKLVRSILEANSFSYTDSHEWNVLWSTSSCKSYLYEGLNEFQKINHFPMSYEITRKDRLCYNYVKMQERFGRGQYDFIPDTYILPQEFHDFHAHYQKLRQTEPKRNVWIVKPANSSQGRGIHIIETLDELNVDETSVISRYVTNPLLINGHKFDLRIYVVVTSYEPLRVYVYKEGLARFASESYSTKFNKNNRYMHLTNYSINKKNEKFVQNEDAEQDDVGFKWSLTAFCNHLEQVGIDMDLMWSRTYDVILKTLSCGDNYVIQAMKKNQMYRSNCFEVFGFDILLDSDLKPWLVEVNLSPSLSPESPLDFTIKHNLLQDTWNLCGIKRFDRRKESLNKLKFRAKNTGFSSQGTGTGKAKAYLSNCAFAGSIPVSQTGGNDLFVPNFHPNPQVEYLMDRLVQTYENEYSEMAELMKTCSMLRFRDIIQETVAEFGRMQNFCRIYPARNSKLYDKYFGGNKQLNKIIYRVFYTNDVLPYQKSIERSINPTSSKASDLQSIRSGVSQQDRLHSSSGLRPAQSSKSNSKLTIQSSAEDNRKTQSNQRTNSQSPTQKRDRFIEQQRSLKNQRNGSASGKQFSGIQQNAPGSTRHASSSGNQFNHPQTTKSAASKTHANMSSTTQPSASQPLQQSKQSKVMITGDDILIEYVSRLGKTLTCLNEDSIDRNEHGRMEKFIAHYVWHMPDVNGQEADGASANQLHRRLTNRLGEMTDRRRRLIKYMFKKENKLDQFESQYPTTIRRKEDVIQRFSSMQLEELLNNSTKNVAQEVVTCLIPKKGEGVLVMIEQKHSDVLMSTHGSTKEVPSATHHNQTDISVDNSQIMPQPKNSHGLPQPVPHLNGPQQRNTRASRSPERDQRNSNRPEFVAPQQYQQQATTHDY